MSPRTPTLSPATGSAVPEIGHGAGPLAAVTEPTTMEAVVAFGDLTLFARSSRGQGGLAVMAWMDSWFELVGDAVEGSGGTLIKTIGDAFLALWPSAGADAAVAALLDLRSATERFMADRGHPCRLVVKAHAGTVAVGLVGPRRWKRFDAYGETVNRAATLESHGFAMTPDLFRSLDPSTRKLFKKHTPAVRYIPLAEPHRD